MYVTILQSFMAISTAVVVCCVTSHNHVINWSYILCVEAYVSYHPAKFGDDSDSGNRDTMVFVCHLTLQNQLIKALHDFMETNPSV